MNDHHLSSIRLVILDVDGVLTPGSIVLSASGEECVAFHVHDGLGIKTLLEHGIQVAIITGRDVPAVKARCSNLGIEHVFAGVGDKLGVYRSLLAELGLSDDQVCFVGDDLPDLGPMKRCGFPVAVANARPEILEISRYRTNCPGGEGAAREVCELILRAQGHWESLLRRFSGTE